MNNAEFQLRGVGDPRLAVYATSPLPVWLWSIDGTRILWAIRSEQSCSARPMAPFSAKKYSARRISHRRQVAQLAKPAARNRRDPAGTPARLRLVVRRPRYLRLCAA